MHVALGFNVLNGWHSLCNVSITRAAKHKGVVCACSMTVRHISGAVMILRRIYSQLEKKQCLFGLNFNSCGPASFSLSEGVIGLAG